MSCIEVKKTPSKSIEKKNDNVGDCLDLLRTDVVELINAKTYHRKEYFVSFVDACFKFSCVYQLFNRVSQQND